VLAAEAKAHLDAFDIPADLVTIPIFGPVQKVLNDRILIVHLAERIKHHWSSERFLRYQYQLMTAESEGFELTLLRAHRKNNSLNNALSVCSAFPFVRTRSRRSGIDPPSAPITSDIRGTRDEEIDEQQRG